MKKFFLLPVFFLLLYSCKKNEVRHVPLDPLVKATFDWHEGSYWVMQDSATGQIDSFYVYDFNNYEKSGYMDYIYEFTSLGIKEVNTIDPLDTVIWGVSLKAMQINFSYVKIGYRLGNSLINSDSSIEIPLFLPCPANYYDINLIKNNVSFSHVYFNYWEPLDTSSQDHYYISSAINATEGIVYLKSNFNRYKHTWYLLRHNIVRKP